MRQRNVRQRLGRVLFALVPLAALPAPRSFSQEFKPAVELPAEYKLVWNDEFEGAELNLEKWNYRYLGKRGHTTVSKESVSLDGKGNLSLATRQKGDELLVGMIGTQETFRQRYGYFECRLKFQKLQGHHGAFWLQSPDYGKFLDDPGKSGAEIDVIEFFGSGRSDRGASTTVHWNPYPNTTKVSAKPDLAALLGARRGRTARPELCDDYHTYGLLWTEREYVVSIDAKETFRTSRGLSHVEQYMVLSLLSSDWERDRLDLKKRSDRMVVDYVRVYARRTATTATE